MAQLKVINGRTLKHLEAESTSDSTFSNSDLKPYRTVVYYKDLQALADYFLLYPDVMKDVTLKSIYM